MAQVKMQELFTGHAGASFTAADKSEVLGARHMEKARLVIQWPASTTAGVFKLESSPNPDFAGTWSALITNTFATANSIQESSITDIQAVYLRVQCTTTVADAATKPRVFLYWEE